MKIQDGVFLLVFVILLIVRRRKILLITGLASWLIAIPLFAKWVFFTAERLTWYGAAFILASLLVK